MNYLCPHHSYFLYLPGLQFAVSVAPRSMKGSVTGIFYFFSGIGSLLGTAIITTLSSTQTFFSKRDSGNINCRWPCHHHHDKPTHFCHLDYYFFFLGGLQGLALIMFLIVSRCFKLGSEEHIQMQTPQTEPSLRSRGNVQRNITRQISNEIVTSTS